MWRTLYMPVDGRMLSGSALHVHGPIGSEAWVLRMEAHRVLGRRGDCDGVPGKTTDINVVTYFADGSLPYASIREMHADIDRRFASKILCKFVYPRPSNGTLCSLPPSAARSFSEGEPFAVIAFLPAFMEADTAMHHSWSLQVVTQPLPAAGQSTGHRRSADLGTHHAATWPSNADTLFYCGTKLWPLSICREAAWGQLWAANRTEMRASLVEYSEAMVRHQAHVDEYGGPTQTTWPHAVS